MNVQPRTALVFSAGGLFGAYQVGVWSVLAAEFQPNLVVGASIGSLNGWAAAGGAKPADWRQFWLESGTVPRLRWPRSPVDGVFDPEPFHKRMRQIYASFHPRTAYALVLTELPAFRPRVFTGKQISWQHLAASCAVPVLFPLWNIDGRHYADGGLLEASPVWAAAALGATRVVEINVMKPVPAAVRAVLRLPRVLASEVPSTPPGVSVFTVAPKRCLGSAKAALHWSRKATEDWIAQGERDATLLLSEFRLWLHLDSPIGPQILT